MTRARKLPAARRMAWPVVWSAASLMAVQVVVPAAAFAESGQALDPVCIARLAETGADSMTLAELRRQCQMPPAALAEPAAPAAPKESGEVGAQVSGPAQPGVIEARMDSDRRSATRPFSVIAHRPNYFLIGAWNSEGWDASAYRAETGDAAYSNDDIESQFQVSLKVPLAVGLLDDRLDIYGAYTNRSFWQVYNSEYSEPFRETNHEPELWAQFRNDWTFFGVTNSVNTVGYVHQSNGRSGQLSRTWDRLFATVVFERAHWALALKPWVWISPDKDSGDNPDLDDYMGHGEVRLVYGRKGHVFSAMLRNQLESGFDRGATELSWSFPVFDYPYLRGYVQYFYGYGESLIDYNQKVNRIGVGISVTDWLD